MFVRDVRFDETKEITFVPHHSNYCSVHRNAPRDCRDLSAPAGKGGALFLMKAIAAGVDLSGIVAPLGVENGENGNRGKAGVHLESALGEVARIVCKRATHTGDVKATDAVARALVRGMFNAATISNPFQVLDLADTFASEDELLDAVAELLDLAFDTRDRQIIRLALQ
jgi:hypothetical protein